MAAQTIDAERALRVGLVHDVYPDDEFDGRTADFARHLVSLPREVLGLAKLAIEASKGELGMYVVDEANLETHGVGAQLSKAPVWMNAYMERAQRRITVNYARRQQGRRMYQAQSTHLPFKINMSGVIPPIFASSILMFPATIASFFGQATEPNAVQSTLQTIGANLGPGQPIYVLLYAALIIFFCFFYTALMFNSKDTADNLKRSGAFVPGIRPGAHTAEYIDKVLTRLTFWGAIYIAGVCLLPEFARMFYPSMPFSFGGTSLLILVVVTMDFMSQMQAHAMSHQYEGMMQKANLRNYGRGGQLR